MSDNPPQANGARVLADLNALRNIGAYKTGVHKPTFSKAAYALAGMACRTTA
jgi:beta-ureidopropionase / N-carbamoyl-L-amino-acid hydrolase